MLGKLLKYEFKATGRIFLPFFAALMVLSAMNRIFFILNEAIQENFPLNFASGMVMFTYAVVMMIICALMLVVTVQRFYKNLLGDEGYLMLTLPVTPTQHIWSKMIVSLVWMLASIAAMILSIMVMTVNWSFFYEVSEFIAEVFTNFEPYMLHFVLFLLELIVWMLVGMCVGILQLYFAMSIGQLWSSHKLIGSFVAYLGVNFAMQILFVVTMFGLGRAGDLLFPLDIHIDDPTPFFHIGMLICIAVTALIGAAFFLGTRWMLSKKTNLE